ncbi:MAG TPA: phosphoribosylformylglycinamidine synthase subunit PurS [Bacillota bacterium]
MSRDFVAHVRVGLKPGVLDPQGAAVLGGLRALGFGSVDQVRVGKWITLALHADGEAAAREMVDAMCRRLLANPVLEDYTFELVAGEQDPPAQPGPGPAPAAGGATAAGVAAAPGTDGPR